MTATASTTPLPPTAQRAASADPGVEPRPTDGTTWYRRAWVLAIAAVLLAVLSFGSGFVAGNAASLFDRLFGGPSAGLDGHGFPGVGEGGFPGDRRWPAAPGHTTGSTAG